MKKRLTALILGVVMVFACFAGCANKDAYKNAVQGTSANTTNSGSSKNDKDSSAQIAEIQAQIESLTANLESANASWEEVEEQMEELRARNNELNELVAESAKALEAANAEKEALEEKVATLETEKAALESEKIRLESVVESLKNQGAHQIIVKDGVIWVHIEDFLYASDGVGALISAEDGSGYALRTLKGVHVKLYDDEHGDEHLVPNFDLPMYDYYTIVLTADEGKTAFTASFGNYSWANRGLMTSFASCEFANELTSMPKNGGSGKQFYNLIKATAVVVEENGSYRFALDAGNYGANPIIQPAEPEVVVKEVCMICGKEDCTGHVETKVETQTVKVCMSCGKEDCTGHVETKVETQTVKVCMICGNENCMGHVETQTVYIPGETIYLPGEKIEYCGRCDNLLEQCTCSDHNDLEDIPDPNGKDTPSDHNDLEDIPNPNEGNSTNHNDLEDIPNSNDNGGSSNHNTTGSHSSLSSSGSNSGSSSKKSAHSPLD